jgi:hypothetical protein
MNGGVLIPVIEPRSRSLPSPKPCNIQRVRAVRD